MFPVVGLITTRSVIVYRLMFFGLLEMLNLHPDVDAAKAECG